MPSANLRKLVSRSQAGHAQIEDGQSHICAVEQLENLFEALRLEDSLGTEAAAQQRNQAEPKNIVIVGNENRPIKHGLGAERHRRGRSSTARRQVWDFTHDRRKTMVRA